MTPIQLYESFIIKANANAQTNNIAVDKGRFAMIFNESFTKFIEWVLDKKSDDDIRYIQPLLTPKKITASTAGENHQLFKLPTDFFDLGSVYATATGDCCKDVKLDLVEIKVDNENFILSNSDTKPSIEYRESPYYLQGDHVKVFTDNFKVDSIQLTYYKYPKQLELIDEEDPESGFKDGDKPLGFDKKMLDRIVSIAVSDYDLNTSNPRYQADKLRVSTKF